MKQSLIRKLKKIQKRYKEIEKILIDTITSSDQKKFRALSIEYSQLTDIVMYFRRWLQVQKDILNAETLLNDLDLRSIVKDELNKCYLHQSILEHKIKISLLPKDINDKRGCFLEIRSGTGGNEASLFAGELFKMYTRYAENMNWKIKIISSHNGDKGGYKEIILIIPDKDTYSYLKYESGGHRVQRVPDTESQGRIHTSTCTVAVIPKIPEKEMPIINKEELRIDTFRSSGAGGQHVNTTDSAIRITHIPTGIVVECQDERSQHKNKAKALSVLGSRLCSLELNRRQKKESLIRKSLLGSGERSDRIRTYNYQQGRITDHRINLTVYKLNEIMNGKLDILINPIMQKYYDDQLSVILGDDL